MAMGYGALHSFIPCSGAQGCCVLLNSCHVLLLKFFTEGDAGIYTYSYFSVYIQCQWKSVEIQATNKHGLEGIKHFKAVET